MKGEMARVLFTPIEEKIEALTKVDAVAKQELAHQVQNVKDQVNKALAYQDDRTFYRLVVWFLGLAGLAVIVAISACVLSDKKGFDALTAIGSAAVGGLVGIFVPSPVGKK